ncbi:uncharacterized protein K460DRAFT_160168 [Cucurbitaria berberidis CBS 394.84]|uniref:YDG domain-containing protein n=1 Tax=Cucurbitaria berberidis CBS 394.84 TaxID=1168544 RepID=A0A9P4GDZ2_9PLEO|nr:uncharacterized protein K460DRAFT_160168 [Cucurbitaria berberidis CBS 394.84]KAF1844198.1 hypothetical protein K460DRAFT_160168 [Cucurbitaria berberidis CBS 394.84]
MYTVTPPANDLSRPRLKQLATWIRDDLDLLVAREGPDVLRPDDVLILHEAFLALRQAHNITSSDLRATGIYRAVKDIAGVATRWPGRLCDDCDKIIAIWTAKFGPLNDLHPFLYGRGGRLEGIASTTEYSKEALLKRWAKTCPAKLHPKLSHRHGNLGFRAGAWWLNSLFAHHAGVVGIESIEGGITFDKHGAYALVLQGTGEVGASSEERFTYRCPLNDKGKFRLTAASAQSREPIRILRSHSTNSAWGPKAGIRYEGLFSVKGWSIRTAKTKDTVLGEWKEGDIVFEIRFERCDLVPMGEVTMHPTANEVDDYTEYKRLRKVHREDKHKDTTSSSIKSPQTAVKTAPTILPPQPTSPPSATPKRKSMFRRPNFDEESHVHFALDQDVISPMTIPNVEELGFGKGKGTLAVPAQHRRPTLNRTGPSPMDSRMRISPVNSKASSSAHTAVSTQSNIRDVAPWIDFEAQLMPPSPINLPPVIREESISPAFTNSSDKKDNPISATQRSQQRVSPIPPSARVESHKSDDFNNTTSYFSSTDTDKKDNQKPIPVPGRNPTAKVFDGVDEDAGDYFGIAGTTARAPSASEGPKTSKLLRHQRSSSNATRRILPSAPLRPLAAEIPLGPNDTAPLFPAIPIAKVDSLATLMLPKDESGDPFVSSLSTHLPVPLPVSLDTVIARPRAASSVTSTALPLGFVPDDTRRRRHDLVAAQNVGTMEELHGMEIKVAFRDPFSSSPLPRHTLRRQSSVGVAPDVVLD